MSTKKKPQRIFVTAMNLDLFGQPAALEQDAIRAATSEDFDTFER
jgi:hypothetical protein